MKYYVINLDKRLDRFKNFREQFSKISTLNNLVRVSGVEYEDETGDVQITRAACSAAHCNAIKLGLESGEDIFTIFEDDIFFYDHTLDLIDKSLQYLKDKDWDLLYWGCVPRAEFTDRPLLKTEEDYILKVMCAGTAHAITYNRKFALNYIKNLPSSSKRGEWVRWVNSNVCHDHFLKKFQIQGKSYTPNEICACQYNGYSDIDGNESNRQDVIEKQFGDYK